NSTNGVIDNNTIENNDYRGIYLYQDSSNHTIKNNTVTSNVNAGILLSNDCNDNLVIGNTASSNPYGICVNMCENNTIKNNTAVSNSVAGIYILNYPGTPNYHQIINNNISSNTWAGLYFKNARNNFVDDNTIQNNAAYGMFIADSRYTTVTNNEMVNCSIFFWSDFDSLIDWNSHTIDTTNTINGKPVHYWKNQTTGTIPASAGQIILANCTNIIVENQDVRDGSTGVVLGFSSNNTIANNTADSNHGDGIGLYDFSDGNVIYNNTVTNNEWGIFFNNSHNNTITNNTVSNNVYGINLTISYDNTIYQNNIIDNIIQAYDDTGTNFWNYTYPTGGNYWGDYAGVDTFSGVNQDVPGSDSIGDTPYTNIIGGASTQDDYPLMYPFDFEDNDPPTSSVEAITQYWHNSATITITATAADNDTNVNNVTLWYRHCTDNASWSDWIHYDVDSAEPWEWSFSFPDGGGYYQFFTIANDTAGNTEVMKSTMEAECCYDDSYFGTMMDDISSINVYLDWIELRVLVADIYSGPYNVSIYYSYSADGSSYGSPVLGPSIATPAGAWYDVNFTFQEGEGYYQFYSIGTDVA
ncbi:MAG: right-handed parallel beta-helix repeat-containing protein, partial [Thermoplasmata archaeon]|nr:right-handed parallel beta-helix repeat-containing protein [Thermoplasmata archaeon]